jgi:protein ImuB
MLWIALAPPLPPPETAAGGAQKEAQAQLQARQQAEAELQALSWWALQFSPRVCVEDGAVLMEVSASARLFDGTRALLGRVRAEAAELAVRAMAVAPTALAALALLRYAGMQLPSEEPEAESDAAPAPKLILFVCKAQTLRATLDALPVSTLAAAVPFAPTLVRLGCATLGPLRALPRGGISRRFGAELLRALDQAYGLAPSSFAWISLPEQFSVRLEFLGRIEVAAGLMFGANRLLLQLKAWLLARQSGVTGIVLHWEHDLQRRSEAAAGSLTIRTAEATRDTTHLARLLAENLDRTPLAAPVVAITLEALGVEARPDATPSLLPEDQAKGESLQQLVERLAARIGPDKVLCPEALADHRPQHMQAWRPATAQASVASKKNKAPAFPAALAQQPPWLLRQPMPLALMGDTPLFQGPLKMLAGPERIEAGWWDGTASQDADRTARDYFLAQSDNAGLVWVYRELPCSESLEQGWFLHGVYG